MAIQLGSAYGKISIDSSGVKSGVDSAKQSLGSLEKSAIQLGETMTRIGKTMTVAISIPLALMAKEAVMMASSYEESLNKVNVVFQENGNVIEEWSKDAAKNLGLSQQAALEAAGTFGNLFTTMGLGRDESAEMSKDLVQLAADLASFNNIDPSIVLEKLRSGLVGEVEPLRVLGIQLSETAVAAKALQMGLITPTVDMSKVNDALDELAEAQQKLNTARQGQGVDANKVTSAERSLTNAYDGVSDAQTKVSRAQEKLNELRRDPEAKSDQIRRAEEALTDAEERLADAQRKASWAQSDLNDARSPAAPSAEKIASAERNLEKAQKAVDKAMQGQVGEMDAAIKLQARYALILEQSKNAQGDFARTSEGLANQLRTLKGNWGDVLKILGDMLLPVVTKLLIKLNEFLEWFKQAPPATQKIIGTILLLAFVIGPLLLVFGKLLPLAFSGATKSMNPFSGGIFGLIGTLIKWIGVAATVVKVLGALGIATGPIGATIVGVSTAISGAVTGIFSASVAAVASFFGAVVFPILLIIGTLYLLYKAYETNFGGIRTTLEQATWLLGKWEYDTSIIFANWVDKTAITFANWADRTSITFANWVDQAKRKFTLLYEDGSGALLNLAVAFGIPEKKAQEFLSHVFFVASGFIKLFKGDMLGAVQDFAVGLFDITNPQLENLIQRFMDAVSRIIETFRNVDWAAVGMNIITTIANGIVNAIPNLINAALQAAQSAWDAAQSVFSGSSASSAASPSSASPNDIARSMVKPSSTVSNSQKQVFNMQFADGVTVRQVQEMLAVNKADILDHLTFVLGGS